MKTASIITVVYNGVNEIEETIKSVLSQNYDSKEYIIIDGGSTDGTIKVIEKYLNEITTFISEPDAGIYDAMNKGVLLANGKWINFMNCGDSFHNNNVLQDVFNNQQYLSDIIYGSVCCFDRYRKVVIQPSSLHNIQKKMVFCHQSSFVRKDLLLKYPFDKSFKICADYNLFYTAFKAGYLFEKTNVCVANYELENGISSRNAFLSEKENMQINQTWFKPFPMFNLILKMSKFYSMSFLKKTLPFNFIKLLKDYKYRN